MRRILTSLLIACIVSISAFPQSRPQIAYRLFSTWADNYQADAIRGKSIAQSILYTGSALSLAGAAATWYGGDAISRNVSGSPIDPDLRQNLTIGLGIGGGALLVSGLLVASVPIKDYRAIYADVFEEKDPEVQEAMAASVLRYQADRGKERRITSFISGFAVPLAACLVTAGINASQGDEWSDGMMSSLQGSSWGMAGSIASLFQKTPEERLYERYLATREELYSPNR